MSENRVDQWQFEVSFQSEPWSEGETERWMAYLRRPQGGPLLWHLGRFAPNTREPLEELPPLNVRAPTDDQVLSYLTQHLSKDQAQQCCNLWRQNQTEASG